MVDSYKLETYKNILLRGSYSKSGVSQSREVNELEIKLLKLDAKSKPTIDVIRSINKAHYNYLKEVLGSEKLFDYICELVLELQSANEEVINNNTDLLDNKLKEYCTDLNELDCYLESASKLLSDASEL